MQIEQIGFTRGNTESDALHVFYLLFICIHLHANRKRGFTRENTGSERIRPPHLLYLHYLHGVHVCNMHARRY